MTISKSHNVRFIRSYGYSRFFVYRMIFAYALFFLLVTPLCVGRPNKAPIFNCSIIFDSEINFLLGIGIILAILVSISELSILYSLTDIYDKGLVALRNGFGFRRVYTPWDKIQQVNSYVIFDIRMLYLKDEDGELLCVIPDLNLLQNPWDFKRTIERHAGAEHPLSKMLRLNKKYGKI